MSDLSRRSFIVSMVGAPIMLAALGSTPSLSRAAITHEVDIKDFEYSPKILNVQVGDKIRWTNRDIAPHTATATDGSWDTGELKRGESATLPVTADMSSDYFCIFHPHMEAALRLEG